MLLVSACSCLCAIYWSQVLKDDNEDVVGAAPTGDAPTASDWSAIILPTRVCLILTVSPIRPLETYFSEMMLEIWNIALKKSIWKFCVQNSSHFVKALICQTHIVWMVMCLIRVINQAVMHFDCVTMRNWIIHETSSFVVQIQWKYHFTHI